jgi:hypothetical protein
MHFASGQSAIGKTQPLLVSGPFSLVASDGLRQNMPDSTEVKIILDPSVSAT